MRTNEIARTRNNPAVKAVAVAVRAAMGLTVSDALRMMVFALQPKRQGLPSRWFPVTNPRGGLDEDAQGRRCRHWGRRAPMTEGAAPHPDQGRRHRSELFGTRPQALPWLCASNWTTILNQTMIKAQHSLQV
ncbi:MAG: type II toxin-antitoxin system RelB/DinJ family antitoxin [Chromatiaceae bacterium]|nr:type II toxin-antitoxin system RelB/DinJ family antitoxin [Chromatiaceae bacterium]